MSMWMVNRVVAVSWIALIVYWLVAATRVKRRASGRPRWPIGVRLFIALLVVLLLRWRGFLEWHRMATLFADPAVRTVGMLMCVLGVGFAIWARWYLGRNWGPPMSLREGHELVAGGPYGYVRHPIYSGILFAVLGTVLAEGPPWLVLLVVYFAFFLYSARTEEQLMLRQFPDQYPAYRRRTKMLIPFLW